MLIDNALMYQRPGSDDWEYVDNDGLLPDGTRVFWVEGNTINFEVGTFRGGPPFWLEQMFERIIDH